MRNIAKIQSVENITNQFTLVPHHGAAAPDATHIWEDSQVFAITFSTPVCLGHTAEGEEIISTRVYRARVEVLNYGDHYLHEVRDMVTPNDFEHASDITAPLHYVFSRNIREMYNRFRLWKKFNKSLEKVLDKPVYSWA